MMEAEIRANYKNQHDILSADYYAGTSGLTKEQFDQLHGEIWTNLEQDLIAAGHRAESVAPRDLAAELDSLSVRVGKLELL